jgi:non-specific serine/threonine protein kinase
VLIALGEMAIWHGASTGARSPAEEGLVLARALGDVVLEGYALNILALAAHEVGDLDQAEALFTQSAELARSVGDRRWEQSALTSLGVAAWERGDHERATALFEAGLPVARAVGDPGLVLHVIMNLAGQLRRQGRVRRAAALQREGLATAQVLSRPDPLAVMLSDAADLAALVGRAEEGARLLGASAARRAAADIAILSLELGAEAETVRLICATIGQPAFVAARAAGAALPLAAAIAEADSLLAAVAEASAPSAPMAPAAPGGLSPREVEVLRLLAADRTNLQIGEALFISEHTVRKHVERILAKLGVESRAGAAAFAVRHGLA